MKHVFHNTPVAHDLLSSIPRVFAYAQTTWLAMLGFDIFQQRALEHGRPRVFTHTFRPIVLAG